MDEGETTDIEELALRTTDIAKDEDEEKESTVEG